MGKMKPKQAYKRYERFYSLLIREERNEAYNVLSNSTELYYAVRQVLTGSAYT
jgi:hypothetical protein